MENKQKLTRYEKFSYGLGDCGASVLLAATSTFLSGYYTDTLGIAAASVATMMLVCRCLDGISDIIMGGIVDKTRSKYGKARPWMLWTAPFMALSLILLFNAPSGLSDRGNLIYAYITYIFQNVIVYTANNLPYNALLSRMTLNVQDRASTSSIRFVMAQLVSLIINSVTAQFMSSVGWLGLSVGYGVVAMLFCIGCFVGVKEHVDEDLNTGKVAVETIPLKTALPALLKNKYFFIQGLMFFFLYIAHVGCNSMTWYFANTVLGNVKVISLISLAGTIPSIIINLIAPQLVKRLGKRKLMIIGAATMMIGYLVIGLAGSNVNVALLGVAIKSFGLGPVMSGIFAMTADVVDYGEWKTGIRSEGLVNSCTSFGMKVGVGLGSAVSAWILSVGGYDGKAAVQSAKAISAIRFGFGYNGAIFMAIFLILCIALNIDKNIDVIQKDLETKRQG